MTDVQVLTWLLIAMWILGGDVMRQLLAEGKLSGSYPSGHEALPPTVIAIVEAIFCMLWPLIALWNVLGKT